VLDPFCLCGTTIHAAQKLGRQWIGIDITYLAINLIKRRLKDAFGEEIEFEEKGQPTDFESAKRLAELDKFQFQQISVQKAFRERFGRKSAPSSPPGLAYLLGVSELTKRGFVYIDPRSFVFLTNAGIQFCNQHHDELDRLPDYYSHFAN